MSLYDPVGMPRILRGTPSHIELATVSVVNSDGTIDAQMVGRTAIKSQLEVPRWYKPVKGDRILTTDIAGDQNRPIVIAFVSDEKGSSKEPQGGFTNPSEPKTELVSVLPGSPVDGQEVYFQNSAMGMAGVVWHLRYRAASSSSHKWEFVGGSVYGTGIEGANSKKVSKTEEALTSGPTLTVPLSGDYEVAISFMAQTEAAGIQEMNAFLGVNGVKQSGYFYESIMTSQFDGVRTTNSQRVTMTSSVILTIRISQATEVETSYREGRITILPVRVG